MSMDGDLFAPPPHSHSRDNASGSSCVGAADSVHSRAASDSAVPSAFSVTSAVCGRCSPPPPPQSQPASPAARVERAYAHSPLVARAFVAAVVPRCARARARASRAKRWLPPRRPALLPCTACSRVCRHEARRTARACSHAPCCRLRRVGRCFRRSCTQPSHSCVRCRDPRVRQLARSSSRRRSRS